MIGFKQAVFASTFIASVIAVSAPLPKEVGTTLLEIKKHLAYVNRMVPFSVNNNHNILESQREGLALIRQRFPDYDSWMAAKPDLKSADVFIKTLQIQQTTQLTKESLLEVRGAIRQILEREKKEMPAYKSISEKISWLEIRAFGVLASALQGTPDSIRGVMVGLAQTLDGPDKAHFFKLANPQAQLEYLERKGLTDQQLRESAFRPEQVGLSRENVTVDSVYRYVRSKIDRTGEIFTSLAYLRALSLAKNSDLNDLSRLPTLLDGSDFDFAYRSNSKFLTETGRRLVENQKVAETVFLQQMRAFQGGLPKQIFKLVAERIENRELIARIFEVPPHLAIYRGCIGGDCSTTRSAFYPYSPWEHVFYIKNERNEFVGYASVTRVKSNGIDTFYLKDLAGAKMSPETARAALFALRQMTSDYGAKRFAIAAPTFTNAQNHNRSIVRMLEDYNKNPDTVSLDFQDAPFRQFLRTEVRLTYHSTASYDDPESHKVGVLIKNREPDGLKYAFEVKKGGLPEYSFQELIHEMKRVVRKVVMNGQKVESASNILSVTEINEAVQVIANTNRSTMIGYFRKLSTLFSNYGSKFDRSSLMQDATLFSRGLLRVSDIMQYTEWREVALHYFFYSIEQSINLLEIQDFFANWKSQIYGLSTYKQAIQRMGQRLNDQDIFLLFAFSEQGSRVAREVIQDPKNRISIERALTALLKTESEFDFLSRAPGRDNAKVGIGALGNLFENLENVTRQQIKQKIAGYLKEFRMKRSDIQSADLQNRIDIALLFAKDSFDYNDLKSHWVLREKLAKNLIPRLEYLKLLSTLKIDHAMVARQVGLRVEQLMSSKKQEDILELQALLALGSKAASRALSSLKVAPEVEQVLKVVLSKKIKAIEDAPGFSKESFEILQFIRQFSRNNQFYIDDLYSRVEGLSHDTTVEFFEKIKEWLIEFGARPEVVLKMPVMMKLVSEKWLGKADAFSSKNPFIIETSLKFLAYRVRAGRDDLKVWERLLENLNYVSQNIEFRKFVESNKNSFFEENCINCGRALSLLALSGRLNASELQLLNSQASIMRLLADHDSFVNSYGIVLAFDHKRSDLINDQIQLQIAQKLISRFSNHPPRFVDLIKKKLLLVLTSTNHNDPAIRAALLQYMANEPLNSEALLAAEAFVNRGGNAKSALKALTLNYPRHELETVYFPQEAEVFMRLKSIADSKITNAAMTCRALFRKAN